MTPDEYCQQKAAASGSSFYYSFMFLPPPRRRAIIALYAFCREVDDAVDEASDAGVASAKLAWWRGEIHAAFLGSPRHPVALALKPVVAAYALPEAHFQAVIDGMAMDLERNRRLGNTHATSASRSSSRISSATSARTRGAAASTCRRQISIATA